MGLVVCPLGLSALCLRRLGKLLGELAEDAHLLPKRVTGICGHDSNVVDDRSGTTQETYELLARADGVQRGLFAVHKKKAGEVPTMRSKQGCVKACNASVFLQFRVEGNGLLKHL